MQPLKKLPPNKPVSGREYNALIDRINATTIRSTHGMKRVETPSGVHLIGGGGGSVSPLKVWRISGTTPTGAFFTCREIGFANKILTFTSGGVAEISPDDVIEQGSVSATVVAVVDESGSWAGGTQAGRLVLSSQSGTFASGNIDTDTQANIATIAADSVAWGRLEEFTYNKSDTNVTVLNLSSSGIEDEDRMEAGNPADGAIGDTIMGYSLADSSGTAINVGVGCYQSIKIFKVTGDQSGMNGPYYRCNPCVVNDALWNTTTSGAFAVWTGTNYEVLNVDEAMIAGGTQKLAAGDFMWGQSCITSVGAKHFFGRPIYSLTATGFDITGARDSNAALADLLTTLENMRLITDNTTAT